MQNKPRFIQCVCTGECPGFDWLIGDMWKLINRVRTELDVAYAVVHPQLCVKDGDAFLEDLLRGGDKETKYIISACDPAMQKKLFKEAFEKNGLDIEKQLISLDLRATGGRKMTLEEAFKEIKQAVEKASK